MPIQPIGSSAPPPVAQADKHVQTKSLQQSDSVGSARGQTSAPAINSAVSPQELQEAVDSMNDFVKSLPNTLNFSIDKDTGRTVVQVIDQATDEVIKQIPSEEMLAISKAIDKLKGLLIEQKA